MRVSEPQSELCLAGTSEPPPRPAGGGSLVVPRCLLAGGRISTRLMTWITPFDAVTSAFVTFAAFTKTFMPDIRMRKLFPLSVFAVESFATSAAVTFPDTT